MSTAAQRPLFDTHASVKRLIAAGVAEAQVAVQSEALHAAIAENNARQQEAAAQAAGAVDTKAERATLKLQAHVDVRHAETQERLARLEGHMDALQAAMQGQFKLLHWMLTTLLAGVALILVEIFFR